MERDMPNDDEVQARVREDATFRDKLLAWLLANGIDGRHVPAGERPSLTGGHLTVRMYVLSATGRVQEDPAYERQLDPQGFRIYRTLQHTVTVPVVVEPDADVLSWLTPPCLTCGR